jgi:hypothetical protein
VLDATTTLRRGTGVPAVPGALPLIPPTALPVLDGTRAPFAGTAAVQALVAAPPPRGAPV